MKWTVAWTARARREADRAAAWWAENRPASPELLEIEIGEAVGLLPLSPTMGQIHKPGIRRLVLQKTRYLIFYSVDAETREIRILGLWSSLRKNGPRFRGL